MPRNRYRIQIYICVHNTLIELSIRYFFIPKILYTYIQDSDNLYAIQTNLITFAYVTKMYVILRNYDNKILLFFLIFGIYAILRY